MSEISSKAMNFGSPSNKFKFTGKEEQRQEYSDGSGLEWTDFGARMYDNQIGRWHVIDPKVDKYSSLSPFDYVGGNPIKRIDPDGMDWYRDDKGTLQFDPNVQSQKNLTDEQKYVGETYQEKNKKGEVTADYRKDGSIMYSKQKDAYNRMHKNSKANGNREEFGVITKNGVLVLPNYNNDANTSEIEHYGYTWKNRNIVDPVSGKEFSTLATIHTHLSLGGDPTPSSEDGYLAAQKMPYKIYLTIGYDGKIHGNYAFFKKGDNVPTAPSVDPYLKDGGLSNKALLDGYDLIKRLQSLIIKK